MSWGASLRHDAKALVFAAVLGLAGCGPAAQMDQALRRIDVLDRIFEPERFGPPPAEPVRVQPLAQRPPETPPQPPPELPPLAKDPEPTVVAAEPIPDPVAQPAPEAEPAAQPRRLATAEVLRREPWLSRFWSALTPNQQARVTRRIPQGTAERWDALGLTERARLFGGA